MTAWTVDDLPAKIATKITVIPAGCWIVRGKPTESGHVRIGGRSAARVVWEHLVGPIDPAHDVDHREDFGCTSKACAFPGHLLDVTHFTNMTRDGAGGMAAINIRKDVCDHGHEFTLLNTYYYKNRRDCRTCIRRRVAEYRQRIRANSTVITLASADDFGVAA